MGILLNSFGFLLIKIGQFMSQLDLIKSSIKSIPDYPQAGIIFRDITSLLEVPAAFQASIDAIVAEFKDKGITKIVGTESRGFIFGAPVALALGLPFELVRKPRKLPRETIAQSYELEYGQDTLEMHIDAVQAGDKVLVIDDLLATGGTVEATVNLIRRLGGTVEDAAFVIELPELGGAARLEKQGVKSFSLVTFEGH
ncbi:Adenine phosphoribosyltransferase [Bibersteinia trehalosi USDA-ARS-USMARC-189]|uniref:Adenine phosphoribosyltransferase n=3 Tax=Bibersteinia trehalosi TaxID=47735 RepID=W0RAR0_BIBTR|nr:Adenine phosphoribosyltransferase [Bibersteinia trehalosi USDA-ARS-USMARC-192]AHG83994.1 Adenine phosphoribosyltransferase [Bibersteinia trehalosi USDA-ARS-USMARC-189]AHG86478.1 Adenine phosphoribosyltransferase [Bibersteinia trehalosi USDA-ARS-USMARC-190]